MGIIRTVTVRPGYHACDRDAGICTTMMTFVLCKNGDAIAWDMFTGWPLPDDVFKAQSPGCTHPAHQDGMPVNGHDWPRAGAVIWHFAEPTAYDQEGQDGCPYLGGARCYGDAGYLLGDEVLRVLLTEGSDAVWTALESHLDDYKTDHQPVAR